MTHGERIAEIREQYLIEAKKHIPKYGISVELLKAISKGLGLEEHYYDLIFPELTSDFMQHYEKYNDQKMLDALERVKVEGVTDAVYKAVRQRVLYSNVNADIWQEVMKYYIKPCNMGDAMRNLWATSDKIWKFAGDKSTDYNFYSKRKLLLVVYVTSILHHIGDAKGDIADTEDFIYNALQEVVQFGKKVKSLKDKVPNIEDIPILRMFL